MTTICHNRHLTYASFRLRIFQQLFDPAVLHTAHQYPSASLQSKSNSALHGNNTHRSFHTSAPRSKDGRGSNSIKNSRRQLTRIQKAIKAARSPEKTEPYGVYRPSHVRHERNRLGLRHGKHGSVDISIKHASETQEQQQQQQQGRGSNGTDGLELTADTDQSRSPDRADALQHEGTEPAPENAQDRWGLSTEPEWSPYTDSGKEELKSMVAQLQILTEKAAEEPRTLRQRAKESMEAGYGSVIIPIKSYESPIERRIEHLKKKKIPKRLESDQDRLSPLYNNVWAQMLSTPIRQEQGTKARMSKDLMIPWGLVRNPEDRRDYLLPIELSDLPELRSRIATVATAKVGSSAKVGSDEQAPAKLLDGERIYIQPNQLLIKAISQEVVKKPSGPTAKSHIASSLLVASMIPWRWNEAINKADVYRRTHKTIDEDTGEATVDDEWRKDVPNMSTLQWQRDIDSRLRTIMSERVMIVLDGLAQHNRSARSMRGRRVYALKSPENGRLVLDGQFIIQDGEAARETTGHKTVQENDNSDSVSWYSGSFFLHVGTPEQYARTISRWQKSQKKDVMASSRDNLPFIPANLYIPPMIILESSDQHTNPRIARLPVFNLPTLLGSAYEDRIKQTTSSAIFDPQFWSMYNAKHQDQISRKVANRALSKTAVGKTVASNDTDPANKISGAEHEDEIEDEIEDEEDAEMAAFLHEQSIQRQNEDKQQQEEEAAAAAMAASRGPTTHQENASADTVPSPLSSSSLSHNDNEEGNGHMVLVKSTAMKGNELLREIWQLWRYDAGLREGS